MLSLWGECSIAPALLDIGRESPALGEMSGWVFCGQTALSPVAAPRGRVVRSAGVARPRSNRVWKSALPAKGKVEAKTGATVASRLPFLGSPRRTARATKRMSTSLLDGVLFVFTAYVSWPVDFPR